MIQCVCDCGKHTVVSYSHLKYGGVKSCGCLKNTSKFEDLTGKTFNNLTVLSRIGREAVGSNGQTTQLWRCKCDCGNIVNVNSRSLKSGNTKSCGCIQGEKFRNSHLNKYDLSGECGVGYCSNGARFLFDKSDYDLIRKYTWHTNDFGYLLTRYKNKTYRMHRLILGLEHTDDAVVDHANHNTLDNRRQNLRVCTNSQNAMNKETPTNNTTGHIGVSKSKKNGKYRAYIVKDGKTYSLGEYEQYEDAVSARESAEKQYYNEFAIIR